MKFACWQRIAMLSVLAMASTTAIADPISDATYFDGTDHLLITFELDGNGNPLPVSNFQLLPGNELAAEFGVTFFPNLRVVNDSSQCFHSIQDIGGSSPYGLDARLTDEMTFDPPIQAVGFWTVVNPTQGPTRLDTYDAANMLIETVTFSGSASSCGPFFPIELGFFGVSSTTPIERIVVTGESGIFDQMRIIQTVTEVLDLVLTSECSEDPDLTREWRITNPNAFNVDATWVVNETGETATLSVPPGDTTFTATANSTGSDDVTLSWLDETNTLQSVVKVSGGVACDDDADGLANKDEPTFGTDPNNPDTDGDGLLDGEEVGLASGSGCPDPLNDDSDGDGVTDAADNNPCNAPPSANIAVEQLLDIGAQALVRLDGSGSVDEAGAGNLLYQWYVDGNLVCDGDSSTCGVIEVMLDYGDHDVELIVTDLANESGSSLTFITLDPSELSVLDVDRCRVNFKENQRHVTIVGQIGLPFGVNYAELSPTMTASINLAGINVVPEAGVSLTPDANDDSQWLYESATGSIRSLKVNWRGSRFKFLEENFPVRLRSELITSSETVLILVYKKNQIGDGFVIDFDGQAAVTVDSNGDATANVPLEVEKPKRRVALTLPFALTEESVIQINGFDSRTIDLGTGDYLQASVGRFRIDADFDPALVPDGVNNPNPSVDTVITVGNEGYFGFADVPGSAISVVGNRWISDGD